MWIGLGTAGMIGAMFGTPVAAALLFSETPGGVVAAVVGPHVRALVAAGAGALTSDFLSGGRLSLAISLPPYPVRACPTWSPGALIAVATALLGLIAIYAFGAVYPLFIASGIRS